MTTMKRVATTLIHPVSARSRCAAVVAMAAIIGTGWGSMALAQNQPATPPAAPAAPASSAAQVDQILTESDVIAGTMDITFTTRTNKDATGDLKPDSPALGAKDLYKFDLTVAKTTQFTGEITRQPNLYSSTLSRLKQPAQLGFKIDLSVMNPRDLKQKRSVGKWVGTVPIDTATGAYNLGAGDTDGESRLRIDVNAIGSAPAFKDRFQGRLVGKAEKKENLAAYTYRRVVGNKTVEMKIQKVDPMRFEGIEIGKGPAESYPRTVVNGRLDYDYETGNWFTDGIRFRYTLNGKEYEDVVTGSIKWVEDPNRDTNGKGYYEFNLRYNEEKNKSATSESAAFEKLSDEDAFFFVDDTIPSLTGRISYVDTMIPSSDLPSTSKVAFNLNANKLTKQQIMNFFKLWMLGIGPTNDE
ncbi:MAG: hypothetical protein SGI72_18615 [Planctomycetota bacterium]|nr:hypothetical protein [Phycisphaerae bacterium]MDZ4775135.1 hypothetical protein [Planctomycetota bacterium]